ncbi:hypothetical protein ACSFA2_25030 [Variovorax sp. LT2P21]|uniref:hypothetical protein n=1 Tax=Variovorax sp. LT2P21 TaxID=3443731 RepID=UPI003F46B2D5
MMSPEKFEEIERLFPKILVFLEGQGLAKANTDASRYFDVGEYGLALEESLEACAEWGGELSEEIEMIFRRLGVLMEMDCFFDSIMKRQRSS